MSEHTSTSRENPLLQRGYYYNITDRSIEDIQQQFGLKIEDEIPSWPTNARILVSGLGANVRFEKQLQIKVPQSTIVGIDASLALDEQSFVSQDLTGVYHIHDPQHPPLIRHADWRTLTYAEYREERLKSIHELGIEVITERVPPIKLPDGSFDIILDINGPFAYTYLDQKGTDKLLLAEYNRLSAGGIYISTGEDVTPPAYFRGAMPGHNVIKYYRGPIGDIVRLQRVDAQ